MADNGTSISWRRNLAVMSLAELLAIAGFSVAVPFLPLYVEELGVQGERAISIWAGLVFSTHAMAMAICGPIWGALSDRYGRKLMVERAMFGGAVVLALTGCAQNMWQFMILRALWGSLTGTISAATTLVASSAPRERVGYALGILQVAIYVGISTGPLLGGFVADTFGYRVTFWVTSGLLFLAGLVVLIFVEEKFEPVPASPEGESAASKNRAVHRRIWQHLAPLLGAPGLLAVMGMDLLARTGSRMMVPVLPLFVRDIAPAGAPVASITGLISGVSGACGAIGALGFGRLGDRTGYRRILIICAVAVSALYLPQFFVKNSTALLFLQAATGLAMGGILAPVTASLARLSPEGQEGIVYGIESSVLAVANGGGPMLGSVLMVWQGPRAPFLAAAVIYIFAGIAAMRLMPGRSQG